MINQYWEKIGGKPSLIETPNQGSGRKRNSSAPASNGGAQPKRRRQTAAEEKTPLQQKVTEMSNWKPPADVESWEDKVGHVETVERTDKGLLLVYLQWYPMSYAFGLTVIGKMVVNLVMTQLLCIKSVRKK